MKTSQLVSNLLFVACSLLPLITHAERAYPQYKVGDIVSNDAVFRDYITKESKTLHDFAGKVIILDWWSYWCPTCLAYTDSLSGGLSSPYKKKGYKNKNGVEVLFVSIHIDYGVNIDNIIKNKLFHEFLEEMPPQYLLKSMANYLPDTNYYTRPLMTIINGVPDEPNHEQWELLYLMPDTDILRQKTLTDVIESIQPPVDHSFQAVKSVFSDCVKLDTNYYQSTWYGAFADTGWPMLWSPEHGFQYLFPFSSDAMWIYDFALADTGASGFLYTTGGYYPFLFSAETGNWLYYVKGSGDSQEHTRCFYDFATNEYRTF
ncbi:MAG: hypothetical protein SFY80_04250 [Verrucomicrobiota bacterium]|nr:hypothetical protein [Verrucomicrobiota bacterium]